MELRNWAIGWIMIGVGWCICWEPWRVSWFRVERHSMSVILHNSPDPSTVMAQRFLFSATYGKWVLSSNLYWLGCCLSSLETPCEFSRLEHWSVNLWDCCCCVLFELSNMGGWQVCEAQSKASVFSIKSHYFLLSQILRWQKWTKPRD